MLYTTNPSPPKVTCLLIIIASPLVKDVHLEEHEKFSLAWVSEEELLKNWTEHNKNHDMDHWFYFFEKAKEKIKGLGY